MMNVVAKYNYCLRQEECKPSGVGELCALKIVVIKHHINVMISVVTRFSHFTLKSQRGDNDEAD